MDGEKIMTRLILGDPFKGVGPICDPGPQNQS